MRIFFHGWRRKAGVVTLVMALALMGLSVRSRVLDDKIIWTVNGWKYLIHSERGVISWFSWEVRVWDDIVLSAEDAKILGLPTHISFRVSSQFPEWQSESASEPAQEAPFVNPEKISFMCGDPLLGFPDNKYLTADHFKFEDVRYSTHAFPNWSLILPLTLLSACLILWKPRKRA
ncbi:MAG: hypothetical protein JWP89_5635 [Schlesneria sp.]|nr:hypothetical protein [Schlesneria sp.]